MKVNFYKRVLYLLLPLLIFVKPSFAQENELVKEWIQKDVEAAKLVRKLLQNLPQDENKIAEIIGSRVTHSLEELGFGAKRIEESQGFGYSSIIVSAFIFKGSIIKYRITIGNSLNWEKVREPIIDGWKQNAQITFKEYEDGVYYEIKNDNVLEEYKQAIGKELGEIKQVKVPNNLREDCEYLTSPMANPLVGNDGCGPAGVIPAGNESINLIVKSKRIDLLENSLRGYNPSGRAYATIAFLEMKKRKVKLKPEIEDTLKKVINLDTRINVCLGGVIFSKTTKEILQEYKLL